MLSPKSFQAVTALFQSVSGIQLSQAKQALVSGRLQRLAQEQGFSDIDAFVGDLLSCQDERRIEQVVDRLTTNETYFFREPEHFDDLSQRVQQWAAAPNRSASDVFRVWSAASSSGEEGYSIAMTLAQHLGLKGWEVVGSDLSSTMVEAARSALYPMERAQKMPAALLKRWCLRGQGAYEGRLLIARELRERVRFGQANLMQPLPRIGHFDVIFLRNVLIYFEAPAKAEIVMRVMERLKPGGVLYTGHAESLNSLGLPVRSLSAAIYEPLAA